MGLFMNTQLSTLEEKNIHNKIYTIRNCQVMLDKDLAALYSTKPIRLREQVKRNIKRFPKDFMFQLTQEEVKILLSQNAIPSLKTLGGSMPYVFTEQGVASLSGVLTSDKAVEVHIQIMRAFIKMRQFIQKNAVLLQKVKAIENAQLIFQLETDQKFKQVFNALENRTGVPTQGIFFNGQVFDAYVFVTKLIKQAKKSIILIDNYIDESVLILLSKRTENCTAVIYTKDISEKLQLDIKKHNEQYSPIEIKLFQYAHDRFLILDDIEFYHIGASLKDLGKKWFAFSKFDKDTFEILKRLQK